MAVPFFHFLSRSRTGLTLTMYSLRYPPRAKTTALTPSGGGETWRKQRCSQNESFPVMEHHSLQTHAATPKEPPSSLCNISINTSTLSLMKKFVTIVFFSRKMKLEMMIICVKMSEGYVFVGVLTCVCVCRVSGKRREEAKRKSV